MITERYFHRIDNNRDGKITFNEARIFYLDLGGNEEGLKMAWTLFNVLKDGYVTKSEFLSTIKKYYQKNESSLVNLVNFIISYLDTNKDGFIDYNEFKHVLHMSKQTATLTDQAARRIFAALDQNYDGKLSWGEVHSAAH